MTDIPKAVRPRLVRERPPDQIKLLTQHVGKMGRVMFEWNAVHTDLFRMFWGFVGDGGKPPRSLATELWTTAQTDAAQRKLLLVYATHRLVDERTSLNRVIWIIKVVDSLSEYRNIAAHLPMEFDGKYKLISPALDGSRRTSAIKHVVIQHRYNNFWETLARDLFMLSQYIECVTLNIFGELRPLPYKPRLLSLPMMKLANDLILEQGHRELPRVRVRPAAFLEIGALVDIAGHGASRANGVRWRAAAIEAVRALNDRGYYVFVLGGGDCALDPEIEARLALEGAHVDRFYGADRQSDSSALDQAMSEWPIVSERSFLVGRPGRQSEAAERVGVAAHAFDGGDLAGLVRAASAKE